jgi:glycosyltransferase involved in cell wall biosynthesis
MADKAKSNRSPTIDDARLVVDLTPLLPGGANGGAKWFVLALLAEMPRQRPGWRWLLLTTARNDALLAELFPSMARLQVIDGAGHIAVRPDPAALPGGGKADLLYCPFTAAFYANPTIPTVATVYDLQFEAFPQFFSRAEIEERARHFFGAVASCARLVCISDYVRRHVLRVSGLREKWVRRIHISLPDRLGVPPQASITACLRRYDLGERRYLLYPANTWPHKNHEMLLTAAGMYFARHPETDLKIVCTGVSEDSRGQLLRLAAKQMRLAERILFPGFLSEPELASLLSGARALIFPSLFEGFGMPVLEAMERGVPVLSANTTSLPEIAGDAALLFDPRRPAQIVRAIEAIEGEPALAERLSRAGRARARALGTAETMAKAYIALFCEVIADERRPLGPWRRRITRRDGRIARDLLIVLSHRARRVPRWLYGRVQLARAALSARAPFLKALAGRVRRTLKGSSR